MSNIEKVIKQAIATFAKSQSASKYKESLSNLLTSVGKLTAKDAGIDKQLVSKLNRGADLKNPVAYVSVFEDANILVSIFILKSNSVIPLHDHPVMHGIVKVLCGSVHVQSYSLPNGSVQHRDDSKLCSLNDYYYVDGELYGNPITVHRNSPLILSAEGECGFLTPTDNNIHEISSCDGPSAFLDILAPPYDTRVPNIGSRQCTYFDVNNCVNSTCTLSLAPYQLNYRTIEIPYAGPKINVSY